MAKKKDTLIDEAEKIKADLAALKKKKKALDSSSVKKAEKPVKKAAAKKAEKPVKKAAAKKTEKPVKKAAAKKTEKPVKKAAAKKAEPKKPVEKPVKVKKLTKKELEEAKREAEKTLEEELEEQLTDEEIENFQIEKVDMERLTNKVCDVLAERESEGMFQSELWKKLKLSSRDGSRLSLKLERMGTITREKLLENNRWTYKLILKKTPISTQSIENAPCLVCPVEQKCSLEGEISPTNCQFIEDWVIAEIKKPAKSK
jgi:DNA-binding MarR family transcriptional regulator